MSRAGSERPRLGVFQAGGCLRVVATGVLDATNLKHDDEGHVMNDDQGRIAELERRCEAAEAALARLTGAAPGAGSPVDPEAALHERDETLRGIFDTMRSGLILVDPQGVIVYANRRMAEMLGRPESKVVGSAYVDHTHGSVSDEARENMHRLMRGEIDHVLVERLYVRSDGETFWGQLSGSRLH